MKIHLLRQIWSYFLNVAVDAESLIVYAQHKVSFREVPEIVGFSYFVFTLFFYFQYFLNTGCFFFLLPVEPLFKMVLWWQLLISRLFHVFLLKLVNSAYFPLII